MAFSLFLIAAASLVIAFVCFDKILSFQYKNYHDEWKKDGKSAGFFYQPPSSTVWSGFSARNVRLLSWTFGSEDWMKKESKILKTVWLMRFLAVTFWISGFVGFILSQGK